MEGDKHVVQCRDVHRRVKFHFKILLTYLAQTYNYTTWSLPHSLLQIRFENIVSIFTHTHTHTHTHTQC